MVRVLAIGLMLVGNPTQVDTQINVSEPQQATIQSEVVQMVGNEVNEVNEPAREVPQEGYITTNDVVDAWDIKIDYAEQEKYVLVDTQEEKLGDDTDEN